MPSCLLFFHKPEFDLEAAGAILRERGLTVNNQKDCLKVGWQKGPELRLYFVCGAHVELEAQEIATLTLGSKPVESYDTRFEIEFDDLDQVLQETNTLIEVQVSLQNATGGFLFNTWNMQVIAPE